MKKVVSVRALDETKLYVTFSDGLSGIFDVTPYLKSEFFMRLKDESYFKQVRPFFTGVGWPDGHDFGPDTIEAELQASEGEL